MNAPPRQSARTTTVEPQINDVIEIQATVTDIYQDGTVVRLEVVDEEGRTVADFTMPTGYGFVVYRAPDPLPPPTREELFNDG
jgi:hypothetical protein